MTLIAAFRCSDGVVICADQQETVGDVRVAVNKLVPQDLGLYEIAIAGSGNGDLLDALAYKLTLDVSRWRDDVDELQAYGNLQALLQDFYANEVAYYPEDSASHKRNDLLVCIKPKNRPDIFLWELRSTVMVPVSDYVLLGIGASIYFHELKRLYTEQINGMQAILLGIHLFSLAKETSNYVGGKTDILIVSSRGMTMEDGEFAGSTLKLFNQKIAELILLCPDTTKSDNEIDAALDEFRATIIGMRRGLMQGSWFTYVFRSITDPTYKRAAFPRLPPKDHEDAQKGIRDAKERANKKKNRRS